jgi:Flp pilus assembly pilin Flp
MRTLRSLWDRETGQAMVEYLLVLALVALIFSAILGLWKGPIAHYLNRILQAIATVR